MLVSPALHTSGRKRGLGALMAQMCEAPLLSFTPLGAGAPLPLSRHCLRPPAKPWAGFGLWACKFATPSKRFMLIDACAVLPARLRHVTQNKPSSETRRKGVRAIVKTNVLLEAASLRESSLIRCLLEPCAVTFPAQGTAPSLIVLTYEHDAVCYPAR